MSKAKGKAKYKKAAPLWAYLVALVVVAFIAYWSSFHVPLVFDDLLSVQKNEGVRFGEFNWNPLSGRGLLYITFTLNYIWTGRDVWSFHLVNLLLHLANGIFLFFAACRIFERALPDPIRSRLYALAASLFFLVHPVQTESVTYISSRSELLSAFFYLLGFLLFVSWSESKIGFLFSLLTAVPFIFGMSAKETVITLPAIFVLYDFIFLSKADWKGPFKRWRFYSPYLLGGSALAYYVGTVTLRGSIGVGLQGHLTRQAYFFTQMRVLVRYISLAFFPVGQNLDYDFGSSLSALEPAVFASIIFLLAVMVLGWFLRRTHPVFSFSIFWFFLTLAPTSSFVPILDVIFEHRLYVSLAGVALSFPLLMEIISRRCKTWFTAAPGPVPIAVTVLLLFTIGTIRRNYVWQDEVRLWEDTLSKSPRKERAYNSLAWAHYKKAEYGPAIAVLQDALKIIPEKRKGFAETLGQLYLKTGRYDEAIALFQEVLLLQDQDPLRALVQNNIGVAYLYKWKTLETQRAQIPPAEYNRQVREILTPAAAAFKKSVDLEITMFTAWDSYINASYELGGTDDIEARCLVALETGDKFNELYGVGKIAFLKGNFARAAEFFERAEKLKTTEKLLYFNHAYALDSIGQPDKAIEKYLLSIRVDTLFIEAHHNVALIYMHQKRQKEAIDHFSEVLVYDPNHRNTNLNLAKLYAAKGDKAAARQRLQTLLNIGPGDQEVIQLWQQLGL